MAHLEKLRTIRRDCPKDDKPGEFRAYSGCLRRGILSVPVWKRECAAWATGRGIPSEWLQVLEAFCGSQEQVARALDPLSGGQFEVVERAAEQESRQLFAKVVRSVSREVNEGQAELFARRVLSVVAFLETLLEVSARARVLRVALIERIRQILEEEEQPPILPPKALRVRAAADYFYSMAAVEHHRIRRQASGETTRSFAEVVERASWNAVSPSVRWCRLEGQLVQGPFQASILDLDPQCVRFVAADRRAECVRGVSLVETVRKCGALGAVSGGFFLYSEPDIQPPHERYEPVGLLMDGGRLLCPPVFQRSSFLQRERGQCEIRAVGLTNLQISSASHPVVCIHDVNPDSHPVDRWAAYTRARREKAPTGYMQWAIAGNRVWRRSEMGGLAIPLNGYVISAPKDQSTGWEEGEAVDMELPQEADNPVMTGMAGGPRLLVDGHPAVQVNGEDFTGTAPPRTFSGDETGDCNLLPRMGVGITAAGRVVFAAVDGRRFDSALGLTLRGLAELMQALGCENAMNLDGGSSKRMVVGEAVVDRPTTEVAGSGEERHSVRPVRSALLIFPRGDL